MYLLNNLGLGHTLQLNNNRKSNVESTNGSLVLTLSTLKGVIQGHAFLSLISHKNKVTGYMLVLGNNRNSYGESECIIQFDIK